MSKLDFQILAQHGNARVGQITLNGVTLTTPCFMPVGTKASIKGMILDMLQDPKYIGDLPAIKLILANTFHLYLRPGHELIRDAGGLHEFENRHDGLILTDSGGFQVFSLGDRNSLNRDAESHNTNSHDVGIRITNDGIHFRSPHDGSKHFFSPEGCVDIQCALGSDIMMVLDICSPAGADQQTYADDMRKTHDRARRQYEHHQSKYDDVRGVLFPIVQGGTYLDLRTESAETLSQYAPDGIAIGGVSVGEGTEQIRRVVEHTAPILPQDKPRYLMGVGMPDDLRHAIEHGIDMFDCVLATRLGRHGVAFSDDGQIKLRNARYRDDHSPLTTGCQCRTCRSYSRAYLHHLIREKEMLGGILLGFHNIIYLHQMLEQWKQKMLVDNITNS